jgi:hypothetical protein
MNNKESPVEMLFEKAEDYGKTSIELLKLNAIDKFADLVSSLATQLAIAIFVILFVITINIGIALWMGELLGKSYYGFFVIAAFYTLVGTVVYTFRHSWVKAPINNSIIRQLFK